MEVEAVHGGLLTAPVVLVVKQSRSRVSAPLVQRPH